MARTFSELSGEELTDISALNAVGNEKYVYRDASGDIVGIAGQSLQAAFDVGQSITIADTDNQTLTIAQNDTTNDPDALSITTSVNNAGLRVVSTGTGGDANAAVIQVTGAGEDTALHVQRFSTTGNCTQAILKVKKDDSNVNDTGNMFFAENLNTSSDSNAICFNASSQSTGAYMFKATGKLGMNFDITKSGGIAINATRNLNESGSSPLVNLVEDNTANTSGVQKIQNDGSGFAINIDQNGNQAALNIDSAASGQTSACIKTNRTSMPNDGRSLNIQHDSSDKFVLYKNTDVNDDTVLRLGDSFIWTDGSGRLRIDSSYPSSDTNGTIVGTQS